MKQLTYSIGPRSRTILIVAAVSWWFPSPASGQGFQGFDSSTLTPVSDVAGQWGLKIVVLDVGQADAILVMTPNGDICLIDSGKTNAHGSRIVDYLSSPALNGIGVLKTIDLLYTTHFDQDHIGGMKKITERGVHIRKAFDQGRSEARSVTTAPAGSRTTASTSRLSEIRTAISFKMPMSRVSFGIAWRTGTWRESASKITLRFDA